MSTPDTQIIAALAIATKHFRNNAFAEAESLCRDILGRDPWNLSAKNLLAGVMCRTNRLTHAIELMEEIVRIAPNQPELRANCAELQILANRPNEALKHLEVATHLRPNHSKTWFLIGTAWEQLRNYSNAAQSFRRVFELSPNSFQALVKLGQMAHANGRTADQLEWATRALQIQPRDFAARRLWATGLFNEGQIAAAIPQFRDLLQERPADLAIRSALMLSLNYLPDIRPSALLEEHLETGSFLLKAHGRTEHCFSNDRNFNRKLRIGYVSSDFKEHAVSRFLLPVFAAHDISKFDIFAYFSNVSSDDVTTQYKSIAHGWRDVFHLSTSELLHCIQQDGIDILVDLGGYSGMHRLDVFAARAAPVQVTWLGYPNTTGLPTIQYLLSDAIADPPDHTTFVSEHIWRLPRTFCIFRPPVTSDVSGSPASSNGYLTFGSLHSLAKLNDQVLDLWCKLLLAVPTSRLLIFRSSLLPSFQPALRQRFADRGISSGRIMMQHQKPTSGSHFDVYHEIDVHLDAFPWNGHTTTCEALWMGVPSVTLRGDRHAARMSASTLSQLGLDEFIAESADDYVDIASRASADLTKLVNLRASLRKRMQGSPLMDEVGFTRELEGAYSAMWRKWCVGER